MNELLHKIADAMRRCDPAWCESHKVEQITDEEWDELLEAVEDACEAETAEPTDRIQRQSADAEPMGDGDGGDLCLHPVAGQVWHPAGSPFVKGGTAKRVLTAQALDADRQLVIADL